MASKMADYKDSPYELEEQYSVGNSSDLADTLRSLKEEIRSCKVDNDIIMQTWEKQAELNVVILQSLSYLQQQGPHWINYEQEDKTNGAYGSRPHVDHGSNRYDTVRDGILLDTSGMRGARHMYYTSFDLDRHYDHHRYHSYMRSDRRYLPNEFKKARPPNFDG